MSTLMRYFELALLGLGLGLLSIYGFFRMHAWFFQAYDSWSFDQSTKKRTHEVSVPSSHPDKGPIAEQEAKVLEDSEPGQDWAPARALAHQNTLARKPRTIIGRLLIPTLNMSVMVLEGTDRWTLNRAVGHIENTDLPGDTGNVGISGHRDGFFRNLGHIGKGDEISLVTTDRTYTYQVESTQIVKPKDIQVLAPSAQPILTLVTCYPFYYVGDAPDRFIVKAKLIH
jgi:LPXTG-site transpeptidase (sortase) family protein